MRDDRSRRCVGWYITSRVAPGSFAMRQQFQFISVLRSILAHYLIQMLLDRTRERGNAGSIRNWLPCPPFEYPINGRNGGAMNPCFDSLPKKGAVIQCQMPCLG